METEHSTEPSIHQTQHAYTIGKHTGRQHQGTQGPTPAHSPLELRGVGSDLHDDGLPLLLVRHVDDLLYHVVRVRIAHHNLQQGRPGEMEGEKEGVRGEGGGGRKYQHLKKVITAPSFWGKTT